MALTIVGFEAAGDDVTDARPATTPKPERSSELAGFAPLGIYFRFGAAEFVAASH